MKKTLSLAVLTMSLTSAAFAQIENDDQTTHVSARPVPVFKSGPKVRTSEQLKLMKRLEAVTNRDVRNRTSVRRKKVAEFSSYVLRRPVPVRAVGPNIKTSEQLRLDALYKSVCVKGKRKRVAEIQEGRRVKAAIQAMMQLAAQ